MVDGDSPASSSLMLIDVDDSYLRMLEEMLVRCNYRVTTCQRVGNAFSLLRKNPRDYDLILSSASMPELEGFKLVYVIRFELQIPVFLMSYDEEPNFVMKGMIAQGSCGYLKKPIHIDTLRNLWQCDYLYSWRFKARAVGQCEDWSRSPFFFPSAQTSDALGEMCGVEMPVKGKKVSKNSRTAIWTEKLHRLFEEAVNELRIDNAKPENILLKMKVEGLTVHEVRRHWRLYEKKLKHSSEGIHEAVSCGAEVPASDSAQCVNAGEASDGRVVELQRRNSKDYQVVERKSVKKPYMLWTVELHEQFQKAVEELGGFDKATPKNIFEMMKVIRRGGASISNRRHAEVFSHFLYSGMML